MAAKRSAPSADDFGVAEALLAPLLVEEVLEVIGAGITPEGNHPDVFLHHLVRRLLVDLTARRATTIDLHSVRVANINPGKMAVDQSDRPTLSRWLHFFG